MRRVAALSMELNVSASELVRMLPQLPSEGAARIHAVERAWRRPGSRDVGERLRPPITKPTRRLAAMGLASSDSTWSAAASRSSAGVPHEKRRRPLRQSEPTSTAPRFIYNTERLPGSKRKSYTFIMRTPSAL